MNNTRRLCCPKIAKIIGGETISFNKWPDPAYCITIFLLEIKWRLLSFHHVTNLMLLRKRARFKLKPTIYCIIVCVLLIHCIGRGCWLKSNFQTELYKGEPSWGKSTRP